MQIAGQADAEERDADQPDHPGRAGMDVPGRRRVDARPNDAERDLVAADPQDLDCLAVRVAPPGPSRVGALDGLTGFVGAPPVWEALLRRVDPHPTTWDRVIAVLETSVPAPPADRRVRRLTTRDTAAVQGLDAGIGWISNTWGGPAGLAASGTAWAAFHDGSAIAVAVPFFVGDRFEDIGVVTHPGHRRQGLSRARAPAVAADIRTRGHIPTWTTSPDNTGSLAVADRLGFVPERTDVLWAVRTPIPDP